ncbi:MAG: ribbon-helix-helix domain-containing protein [Thermoplasmata archaeon]
MAEDKKYTTVSIPTPLFEKIQQKIKDTGFTSVSDYVTFVLREILAHSNDNEAFSEEDEKKVKERLKSLGYLD